MKRVHFEKELFISQSNTLIRATHLNPLTLLEQKFIAIMISKIHSINDKEFNYYSISTLDFIKILGVEGTNKHFYDLKTFINSLMDKRIEISYVDSAGKEKLLITRWISSVELKVEERNGTLEVGFDPKLKPFLLELRNKFTRSSLKYILCLNSVYSPRMYYFLDSLRFRKDKKHKIPLSELRACLSVPPEKYRKYSHFKSDILLITQRELKAKTDLSFEFKGIRKGRKTDTIEFEIQPNEPKFPLPKAQKTLPLPETPISTQKITTKPSFQKGKIYPPEYLGNETLADFASPKEYVQVKISRVKRIDPKKAEQQIKKIFSFRINALEIKEKMDLVGFLTAYRPLSWLIKAIEKNWSGEHIGPEYLPEKKETLTVAQQERAEGEKEQNAIKKAQVEYAALTDEELFKRIMRNGSFLFDYNTLQPKSQVKLKIKLLEEARKHEDFLTFYPIVHLLLNIASSEEPEPPEEIIPKELVKPIEGLAPPPSKKEITKLLLDIPKGEYASINNTMRFKKIIKDEFLAEYNELNQDDQTKFKMALYKEFNKHEDFYSIYDKIPMILEEIKNPMIPP